LRRFQQTSLHSPRAKDVAFARFSDPRL
jgi:hypothetical protein